MHRFVDTSFLIALVHEGDVHRPAASAALGELEEGDVLVTTDLVVAEFFNRFAERAKELRARASAIFEKEIRGPGWRFERLRVAEYDEAAAAYGSMKVTVSNAPGLVDLHSMVVMRRLGIDTIWTFDPAFKLNGFKSPLPIRRR